VRGRLLEAAALHFAERGLQGASVDRISLAAGLAKGTVYNYFESKEQLFAAVLAEGCRRAVARYASVPHRGPVRDCLLALAEADVAVLREDEGFMIRDDRPTPQLAMLFVGLLVLLYVQHWGSSGAWPSLDEIPELAVSSFLDGARRREAT
jgi:AcrR family transcriptional regulator